MWFVVFRAQVAMNSQALLRYHQHKMYTYADVFLFQYSKNEGGLGPNGMTSVYLVCDGGKTNQNGRCNANCIVRAEDMMTDPVGSFVDYLFYVVHVKGDPLPNPVEDRNAFYNAVIFPTSSYNVDSTRRRELHSKLDLQFSATMHVDRRHGAIAQHIRG